MVCGLFGSNRALCEREGRITPELENGQMTCETHVLTYITGQQKIKLKVSARELERLQLSHSRQGQGSY